MARRRLPEAPFETIIGSLGEKGAGSAQHDGRDLAVWGALPGETVLARYLFGRRMRGQAETLEVIDASPQRVTPPCPHFGTCSACAVQHLSESEQLAWKQERLLQELSAQSGLQPRNILPPLTAGRWRYRRKARLSVRDVKGKGRVLVGFRERDGRFVTDMDSCHTLVPLVADALPALVALVESLEARATIPQIEASCGDDHAVLVIRHLEPLSERDLVALTTFETDSGLRLYLQPGGPDTVAPLTPGPSRLTYRLPEEGLLMAFEPLDFVQVNNELNRLMIDQAMDLLAPGPEDRALDLFCGLGNFTLPIARRCAAVTGLEGAANLVRRARENASANRIDNAFFDEANLYDDHVGERWPTSKFDRVLLDPPRSGAGPVLSRIAATGARRVVYVSCNPRTLAEDACVLQREHGYSLEAAGAMDMFPQTPHIEAMALFVRSPV